MERIQNGAAREVDPPNVRTVISNVMAIWLVNVETLCFRSNIGTVYGWMDPTAAI